MNFCRFVENGLGPQLNSLNCCWTNLQIKKIETGGFLPFFSSPSSCSDRALVAATPIVATAPEHWCHAALLLLVVKEDPWSSLSLSPLVHLLLPVPILSLSRAPPLPQGCRAHRRRLGPPRTDRGIQQAPPRAPLPFCQGIGPRIPKTTRASSSSSTVAAARRLEPPRANRSP